MYEQKDIVLVPFPYSDLTETKQRPALIISNSLINKSQDRICCLITSNPSNMGILIGKKDFQQGNLPFESWIKPYRIFSVSEKVIEKKLCVINNDFYKKIIEKINSYFKLEN